MTGRSIGPRRRFEVFKRDDFTCRYCGRKTPDAVLEVDHVIPVAHGGDDDVTNLVTSCWECNRGKGSTLLDAVGPVPDMHDQTILLLEREMQVREYNAVKKARRERENAELNELYEYWDDLNGGKAPRYPRESVLRRWLRVISGEDIKDAMEIAIERVSPYHGPQYLAGILRSWAKERGITDIGPTREDC